MRVGIISDVNGERSEDIYRVFAGVDYIICAGDMGRPSVLWELEAIAPTYCCLGNNAWQDYGSSVRKTVSGIVGGAPFAVTHYPQDAEALARSGEYKLVVHGHTHVPRDEVMGECRIINPGSASRTRKGSARQCLTVEVADGIVGPARAWEL